MAVEPTGNISQVMEILRRQISNPDHAQAAKTAVPQQAPKTSERDRAARGRDPKALERRIAGRIRLLPLDTEKELRVAIRLFMEDILLEEFGDELGQDPSFYEMIDGLAGAASKDENLSGEFLSLFRSMA